MSDENKYEAARSVFDDMIDQGRPDDDIKMAMIQADPEIGFSNITRVFNQFMIDGGHSMSKEDLEEVVNNVMDDADVSTEDGFDQAVTDIVDNGENISVRKASALVRSYAKKNEMEYYTKPKGTGTRKNAFIHRFYNALVDNPDMTEEECHDFLFGLNGNDETSQNVKNYEKMHQNVRALVNRISARINEKDVAA